MKTSSTFTIFHLCAAYSAHAATYYGPTTHALNVNHAIAYVESYGAVEAAEFGPLELKAILRSMAGSVWIKTGQTLTRQTVNKYLGVVRHMFKWAVAEGMVPVEVYQRLMCVDNLKRGRSEAREPDAVTDVPRADIDAVLAVVSPKVRRLILLQLATAARPGELVGLRPTDIDTTGPVWTCRLAQHKNAWRGKSRTLYFGPNAQAALKPLMNRPTLFGITERGYWACVTRACVRAGVPRWTPNQLRHTAATEIEREFGWEAARLYLGHSSLDTTKIYVAPNETVARAVAQGR